MSEKASNRLEEIFVNHVSGKTLLSRIHKEFSKLSNKEKTTQFKKWGKHLNSHVTKEEIWMTIKHIRDVQYY